MKKVIVAMGELAIALVLRCSQQHSSPSAPLHRITGIAVQGPLSGRQRSLRVPQGSASDR